ncbi:MarC family protein [Acidobacterium sp. S8]|uniref:MarC family protein n=1 Tax=Acidobacterium sp. S8 TaxID=1641854 RepID=UPI00131C5FBC|nr:MarC family protein [Acidobacterium sp. S8]
MIDLARDVSTVIEATVLVVGALFPIVNPLGSAAIFINMIGSVEPKVHRALTQKIAIYSFFLLICSLLWGVKILTFFGISIYAVQIGGGLLVAATGWSLLSQGASGVGSKSLQDDNILDHAFYPYTLPITIGPGSISVAVAVGAHLPAEVHARSFLSPEVLIAAIAGSVIICLIIYICYRYANAAERLLGSTGTAVVMRLCSFILMCIGVQILCTGVKDYLATIHFS